MSEYALKPSLASLPPELLSFIILHPLVLHPDLSSVDSSGVPWDPTGSDVEDYSQEGETLLLLRALSQTSQRLRNFTLPLLWSALRIETVATLGKVRDALRHQPHLAQYVRHFSFEWSTPRSVNVQLERPEEPGTLLDFAFIDHTMSMFGTRMTLGPDDAGADARLKSAKDFKDCCTEIVTRFAQLESFRWECQVTPMPRGVFEALKKVDCLRQLSTPMCIPWRPFHYLPLWEIASQLRCLIIDLDGASDLPNPMKRGALPIIAKSELASIDAPTAPLSAQGDVIYAMAGRTIAAAAQGKQLEVLVIGEACERGLWKPFAVPGLLPAWVRIKKWITDNEILEFYQLTEADWEEVESKTWAGAAMLLRRALFHVARSPEARARHLSGSEVQSMHKEFTAHELPRLVKPCAGGEDSRMVSGSTIELYFRWLRDNAELAQQVVDAWNDVVERGGAYDCKCHEGDETGSTDTFVD